MKIEILDEAEKDLVDGLDSTRCSPKGLGTTFLTQFFQTLNPFISTWASTPCTSATIDCRSSGSLSPSTIVLKVTSFACMRFWIVGGIRHGFVIDLLDPRMY